MAATRQAILDAAERLLKEAGYENTSMDAIALAAGVSRKTLFNYMESKAELTRALIERRLKEPYTRPFKETVELSTGTLEDLLPPFHITLKALWEWRWLLRAGVEHANLFSSDQTDLALDHEPNRNVRIIRAEKLQAIGKLRSDIPAEHIVRHFEVLRNAVFRQWLKRDDATFLELTQEVNQAMSLLIHGLNS